MIALRNVENVLRLDTGGAGNAQHMIVFEYTCSDCGPFQTVAIEDFSKAGIGKPPLRCPHCRGPVSIDIVTALGPIPSDAA
jgi:DNA-directed RNA polymerase subunit RPC12/RpoP